MTFKCSSGGATISSVRWRFIQNGADVIPQIALIQQGGGCSQRTSTYGDGLNNVITVALCTAFSTLNVTASVQLDGILVECLLIISGVTDVQTQLIRITRKCLNLMTASIAMLLTVVVYRQCVLQYDNFLHVQDHLY